MWLSLLNQGNKQMQIEILLSGVKIEFVNSKLGNDPLHGSMHVTWVSCSQMHWVDT
jgi:hypothetical protein